MIGGSGSCDCNCHLQQQEELTTKLWQLALHVGDITMMPVNTKFQLHKELCFGKPDHIDNCNGNTGCSSKVPLQLVAVQPGVVLPRAQLIELSMLVGCSCIEAEKP